jgi:hypothetical protein
VHALPEWIQAVVSGESGEWARADVLIGFSESPENIALVGSAIENGIWLG